MNISFIAPVMKGYLKSLRRINSIAIAESALVRVQLY